MTYNFNAGPAMLPKKVMEKAKEEFLNYQNSGMSIMEVSHRGKHFQDVLDSATADLRKLLNISKDYSIGFFPGGATLHFSAIPMNLLTAGEEADYSLTGVWSVKAQKEAEKLGFKANIIYDGSKNHFTETPVLSPQDLNPKSKYLFITSNNTIYGSRYPSFPKVPNGFLVADMTSELLARRIDVNQFGLIFAGAQKNIGPSGLTLVIIRNDLLEIKKAPVPVLLDYKVYMKNNSLYNTPPTFSIYMAGLVFQWCLEMGGLEVLEKINQEKASLLYDYIDQSALYTCPVQKPSRSEMNVVFHLRNPELESKFVELSEKEGLVGLAGHRDAGGMRASIYNAMPLEGVQKLIEFMKGFEKEFYKP